MAEAIIAKSSSINADEINNIVQNAINNSKTLVHKTEIINESTVWQVPNGVINNQFEVRIFGGGGGGACYVENRGGVNGCGGGGGWMNNAILTLEPFSEISISIGGGSPAYYNNEVTDARTTLRGDSGGTTSFGTYLSANGGGFGYASYSGTKIKYGGGIGGSGGGGIYNNGSREGCTGYQFGGGGGRDWLNCPAGNGGTWGGGGGGAYKGGRGGTYGGGGGGANYGGNGGTWGGGGGSNGPYGRKGTYGGNGGNNTVDAQNGTNTYTYNNVDVTLRGWGRAGNECGGGGGYGGNGGTNYGGGGGYGGNGGTNYGGGGGYGGSGGDSNGGGGGYFSHGGNNNGGGGGYYGKGGNNSGGGGGYGKGGEGKVQKSSDTSLADGLYGGGGGWGYGTVNYKNDYIFVGKGGDGLCIIQYWKYE